MAVPYTFATASGTLALSQLDSNFSSLITIGSSTVGLGSTITSISGLSLSGVTLSGSSALGTPTSLTLTNATGLPLGGAGVTGTLGVANGGTGLATLGTNSVLLGNGTSAVQSVAPLTSGNILASNGTTWTSSTPATSGIVTNVGTPTTGQIGIWTGATTIQGQTVLGVANGGTGSTSSTGTAGTANVLATSPTIATPTLTSPTVSGTAVIPTINAGASTALTLQSNSTTALTLSTTQNATLVGNLAMASSFMRNRIINGAMGVAQRGTSFATPASGSYTLDRFFVNWTGAAPATVAQIAGPTGYQYAIQITGAASNTALSINQNIESNNIADLASTTVTLSATILASTAQTVGWAAYYPTAIDNYTSKTLIASGSFSVLTTSAIYSTQINLPANAANGLQIVILPNNGGAFTSGTLTVTGIQIEPGSIATPFERRSFGEVLMLCQRYYYSTGGNVIKLNSYVAAGAASGLGTIFLPVVMRTIPTTVVYNSPSYSNCSLITTEGFGTTQAISTYVTGTAAGAASVIFGYSASAEL